MSTFTESATAPEPSPFDLIRCPTCEQEFTRNPPRNSMAAFDIAPIQSRTGRESRKSFEICAGESAVNERLLDWVELPDGRVEGLSYPPELDRLERQFAAHKSLANYDAIWEWRIAALSSREKSALRSWRDMRGKYEALRRKHEALVHGLKSLLSTPENKSPC